VGKAVENDFFPIHAGFVNHPHTIGKRFARVDDNGAGEGAGLGELGAKGLFLPGVDGGGFGGILRQMEAVEANFAEGYRARAIGSLEIKRNLRHLLAPGIVIAFDIARVQSDSVIHPAAMGGGQTGVELPVIGACPNGDDARNTGGNSAVERASHVVAAVELSQMAMGVD
jgi:hypothetical protein